jgi:predicted ester cyclase
MAMAVAGCASTGAGDRDDAERNRQIVIEAFEVVGAGDYDAFDRYIAADYVRHCQATPGLVVTSLDDFKAFIRADRESVPDQSLRTRYLVAEGDLVAFYATCTGTRTGRMGPCPPSGRGIDLDFAGVHRLEGGKIAETWITWDNVTVLTQIGHAPTPEP